MIGFYGGSFNPIHFGHLTVAEFILQSPNVSEICFTPVYKHPFDKQLVPFSDRVKMIELAIREKEGLCVSDAEAEKGGVSYTVDLLSFLKKRYGNDFFFIGGLDTLNSIDKWKDWEEIVSNYNILFTTRAGVNVNKSMVEKIERVSGRNLKQVKNVNTLYPGGLNIIEVPDIPLSSREIRDMIKKGKDLSGILPADVISYIYRKKFYKE